MDVFSAFDPGVDLRPAANASGELKVRFSCSAKCINAASSNTPPCPPDVPCRVDSNDGSAAAMRFSVFTDR